MIYLILIILTILKFILINNKLKFEINKKEIKKCNNKINIMIFKTKSKIIVYPYNDNS